MRKSIAFLVLVTTFIALNLSATEAKVKPGVKFISPQSGDTVPTQFKVKFAVVGMSVEKAGVMTPETGHHHLIIDGAAIPAGTMIIKNDTHLHFGDGQTEAQVKLTPGKHKLTLQFADGAHMSFGPALSKTIEITVR